MATRPETTLREIYADAGKSDAYFEDIGPPVKLYRCQTTEDFENKVFVLMPRHGGGGPADVVVVEREGQQWVEGCAAVGGKRHTGVSTFDKAVSVTPNHSVHYEIPASVALPPGLAITRDNFNKRFGAIHYTLAPKNDMPLELFLATLKVVADVCVRIA